MPYVPINPVHEREHIERTSEQLRAVDPHLADRWDRAIELFGEAELYDSFLELRGLASDGDCPDELAVDVRLQMIRCIRDAPLDRLEREQAKVEPETPFQRVINLYRTGWIELHRREDAEEADSPLRRAKNLAREVDSRPWECAAQLQLGHASIGRADFEEAMEHFTRVYNLSRRNGLVEFISKATMGKARARVSAGRFDEAEELFQKAFELADRNELVPEKGLALMRLARFYHRKRHYYGLAVEYYDQADALWRDVPLWPSLASRLESLREECRENRDELDIAKLLGPQPIDQLRKEYLSGLVSGFVGIPGIENRTQLGERVDLTRQAIHRNITKS
jgi:tetratricopeptide (TPR) repeat protein